ncbi:MAG: glycosyltransferase family 2 protein [Elusimicrobia bacterium]|nr:glycosyltransferase family 2 protein [Elusimicrobiota bacterium]
MKKLSIIVPVYNEKNTIQSLLERVRSTPYSKEILVVDDGSTDGTREILKKLNDPEIALLFHEKNKGKGAAIRTAIPKATGEIILIQDADLEYDPKDYALLLGPILDDRADVVYGSRFLGGPHRVLLFWHYMGNLIFTLLTNILYNINLTDMGTCYKVFRAEILKAIPLRSDRFGFEPEITAKICKRKLRIYEAPISYSGRTYNEGKKISWRDGFVYLWCLLRYRFSD